MSTGDDEDDGLNLITDDLLFRPNGQLAPRIKRSDDGNKVHLYTRLVVSPAMTRFPAKIIWAEVNNDEPDLWRYDVPLLRLNGEEASRLMDELWNAGVRPSNGAGSHATHEAMSAHIKDLQKVIDRLMDAPIQSVELPGIDLRTSAYKAGR
jgi:hypothetical protein